jgi:hypothetical protein
MLFPAISTSLLDFASAPSRLSAALAQFLLAVTLTACAA